MARLPVVFALLALIQSGCSQSGSALERRLEKAAERAEEDARQIDRLKSENATLKGDLEQATLRLKDAASTPACGDAIKKAVLVEKLNCELEHAPPKPIKPACNCKPTDPLCDCL